MRALRGIALVSIAMAAVAARARAAQPEPVVRLTIRPVAATQPSLKYKFLPELIDQTPGNAATLYLMASKLGPEPKQARELMDEAWNDLELPPEQLSREKAEQLLGQFEGRLRQADLAAHRTDAQWDPAIREEGADALLPYINDIRGLAILWALKARVRIAENDWPAAARAIGDGFTLARQLNREASLIQGLVETGIAAEMLEHAVRDWVSRPDAPNLYWSLSSLPEPFVDVHEIGVWEKSLIYFTFPVLRDAQHGATTPAGWQAFLVQLPDLAARTYPRAQDTPENRMKAAVFAALTYPRARAFLIASGRSSSQVDAMTVDEAVGTYCFEDYRRLADEAWKAWALPFWEGRPALQRSAAAVPSSASVEVGGNPLAAFAPRVVGARFQFAKLDREIALLRVVEAVRDYAVLHDGQPPDSLEQIKDLPVPIDPVRGQPFRYERHGQNVTIEAPPFDERPEHGERYELKVVK